MKRTKELTQKRLFIEELERPAPASEEPKYMLTTLAIGEESGKAK